MRNPSLAFGNPSFAFAGCKFSLPGPGLDAGNSFYRAQLHLIRINQWIRIECI